jgi:hypothetical protein
MLARGSACDAVSWTLRSGTSASSAAVMRACRSVCGLIVFVLDRRWCQPDALVGGSALPVAFMGLLTNQRGVGPSGQEVCEQPHLETHIAATRPAKLGRRETLSRLRSSGFQSRDRPMRHALNLEQDEAGDH